MYAKGVGEFLKHFDLVLVTTVLVRMKLQGQTPISLTSARALGRGLGLRGERAKNQLFDLEPHPEATSFQMSLQSSQLSWQG